MKYIYPCREGDGTKFIATSKPVFHVLDGTWVINGRGEWLGTGDSSDIFDFLAPGLLCGEMRRVKVELGAVYSVDGMEVRGVKK